MTGCSERKSGRESGCDGVSDTRVRFVRTRQRIRGSSDDSRPGRFSHPARCSVVVEESDSLLLRRQWHRENDVDVFGVPAGRDVCFGFADSSGRLTVARLESLSRDILTQLEPDPWTSDDAESVPWILTLTTGSDQVSRREIVTRHPTLDVRRPLLSTS